MNIKSKAAEMRHSFFDLHKTIDIMSNDWLCELEATADFAKNNMLSSRFDRPLTAYLDYYVRRYYLSAIDSFNVISTIKRMVCAYIVTAYELERLNNPTQTEIVKILQDIQKRSNIPMKTANSSKMNLSSIHFFQPTI